MSRRRLALAAMTILCGAGLVALFVGYLRLSQTVVVGSDGGTIALQAWDMLHGNVLLHSWAMSDVSFYTTELPEYALVERLNGLSPDVVHIAGALTYVIVLLVAALVVKEGSASGREAAVRVLITVGIMLAPAPGFGASTLLLAPDHLGSAVPVLLAWLVVDRCPPRWQVPVIVGAILAWGLVADPLIEVTGVIPMVLVCGIRAAQKARREQAWWFEAALGAAPVAAVGAAALATALIHAAGGYVISPVQTGFAGFAALPHNAFLTGQGLLLLFGASFVTGQPVNMLFSVLHLAGVALVVVAFVIGLRRLFRRDELLVPALAVAIALNGAVYLASRYPVDLLGTREITEILPLGAVLAGRVLARPALRAVPALGAVVAGAVLAGYGATLGVYASMPRVPALHQDLAGWLVAHHLHSGLAPDYWVANITTVDSGGRVRVVWVSTSGGSMTRPPQWHVKSQWYEPGTNNADFLVTATAPGSAAWHSAVAAARGAFGPPASIRRYQQYTVIIWSHNLLPFLH